VISDDNGWLVVVVLFAKWREEDSNNKDKCAFDGRMERKIE
jgi:hypothetical protein